MTFRVAAIVFACVASCSIATAEDRFVTTAAEAKVAIESLKPGDSITFADGDYDLGVIKLRILATETATTRLRAQHVGKARLVGGSSLLLIRASHVVVEGFTFSPADSTPLAIDGCDHVRITRNTFSVTESDPDKGKPWLQVQGVNADSTAPGRNSHHVRIDRNRFENKRASSNFIQVNGLGTQVSQHVRIDRNHFANIGPRITNGKEAIRVGLSGLSLSDGFNIVERNLFEDCDGDPEIVSIKCGKTKVVYNTFVHNQGGVCLRHGNGNEVSGNFIIGAGKKGSDGIREYGDDHRIFNNYLHGLAAVALQLTGGSIDYGSGETEDRKLLTGHFRPRRIAIAFNTVIDCAQPIGLGRAMSKGQLPPQEITIANNLVVSTLPDVKSPVAIAKMPEPLKAVGNVAQLVGALEDADARRMFVVLPSDTITTSRDEQSGIVRFFARDDALLKATPVAGFDGDSSFDRVGASALVGRRPLAAADVGPDAPASDD